MGIKRKSKAQVDSDWDTSSDEESTTVGKSTLTASKTKSPSKRPSKPAFSSSSDDADSDWNESQSAAKKAKKKQPTQKKSKIRKVSASSSDEMATPPSRSRAKQPTAASSDEDLTDEDPIDMTLYDDGLDKDLFRDADDRKWIESMTEFEREEEMLKRLEHRESLKKRYEIELKLRKEKSRDRAAAKKVAKSAASNETAGGMSRSRARQQAVKKISSTNKTSALSDLVALREEKKRKENELDQLEKSSPSVKKKKLNVDDIYSDESDSDEPTTAGKSKAADRGAGTNKVSNLADIFGDSGSSASSSDDDDDRRRSGADDDDDDDDDMEDEIEDKEAERARQLAMPITSADELDKIRLSRDRLSRWVHSPFFKETVVGCFVRVGIGNNMHESTPVYRVAEIKDVLQTAKTYLISCANERLNTRTNKGLRLRHAHAERTYRLAFVSNQKFEEHEFQRWLEAMSKHNIALPTKGHVERKLKDIEAARNAKLTDSDVKKIVEEKKRFRQGPINFAMHKAMLIKQRDQAVMDGNEESIEDLNHQLEDLERRAADLDNRRTSNISVMDKINNKNRMANLRGGEQWRQAMAEELRGHGQASDPFTRRHCQPTMITRVADPTEAALRRQLIEKKLKDTYRLDTADEPTPSTAVPADGQPGKPVVEQIKKHSRPQDLYDLHKVALPIDINIPSAGAGAGPGAGAASSSNGAGSSEVAGSLVAAGERDDSVQSVNARRAINLDDYKRRKGLI